jgi:hypothetical protein
MGGAHHSGGEGRGKSGGEGHDRSTRSRMTRRARGTMEREEDEPLRFGAMEMPAGGAKGR